MNWHQVQNYLLQLVQHDDPVLTEMEALARKTNFPIVDRAVGQCCYLLARLAKVRSVFEMGSGFGYSTAWFAMAVRDNGGGVVHHVVWDEKLSQQAREFLDRMGLTPFVRFTVGEAVTTLRTMPGQFGCIFLDIDKEQYPEAVAVAKERLTVGGLLIMDNALMHGEIFGDRNPRAIAVRKATEMVCQDPSFVATLLPIRDGLLVAMKVQ